MKRIIARLKWEIRNAIALMKFYDEQGK